MFLNSRRTFLKKSFLSTAVLVMAGDKLFGAITPFETLVVVQEDLFPYAKELGSNASAYISLILNHSRVTDKEKAFIRNGVQWLNEEAILQYKKLYTQLSPVNRQNILHTISNEKWGERWLYTLLTYTMEAMLGDPIYGINKNESGWKWLNFAAGIPRPTKALL